MGGCPSTSYESVVGGPAPAPWLQLLLRNGLHWRRRRLRVVWRFSTILLLAVVLLVLLACRRTSEDRQTGLCFTDTPRARARTTPPPPPSSHSSHPIGSCSLAILGSFLMPTLPLAFYFFPSPALLPSLSPAPLRPTRAVLPITYHCYFPTGTSNSNLDLLSFSSLLVPLAPAHNIPLLPSASSTPSRTQTVPGLPCTPAMLSVDSTY